MEESRTEKVLPLQERKQKLMNQVALQDFLEEWNSQSPTITVHTSGSTGTPKQLLVEKRRMLASARMTCDFLGLQPGDTAFLCMPMQYIAGKMMVVRSIERDLHLIAVEPSGHPLAHPLHDIQGELFGAMVPLQVWNSLQIPAEREQIKRFHQLIIGGGSISSELEQELRTFPNAVWSTYGMTETLSHIAMRRLSGPHATKWYTPLPGIKIGQDENQCLTIQAPELNEEKLFTHDIVEINAKGQFIVKGRLDNVICSGGIKIQIEEVEEQLSFIGRNSYQITAVPDSKFGEVVVLLSTRNINLQALKERITNPYWMPRHVIHVDELPRTETGKPDRARARIIAAQATGKV